MHLFSMFHEGFSSLYPQCTMGFAKDTSWAITFLHPPVTLRYPAKTLKKKGNGAKRACAGGTV